METPTAIPELLRRQDGVITRAQALARGLPATTLAEHLASGLWSLLFPGVYLSCAHAWTARARLRAVTLWLGPAATLLATSAAWWWRLLDDPPSRVTVAIPPGRRVRSRPGVRVVRRAVPERFRVVVDGVAIASRAYAVAEAAGDLGMCAGAALMDRALLSGRVTLEGLRQAHHALMTRPGSALTGRLLVLAAGGARSDAERRLHRVLHRAGVAGWRANLPVALPRYGRAVVDVAFPARRIAVEVDGWAFHRDLPAVRRDRARQNALVLAGWTVIRFGWHDVVGDPDAVLAAVTEALAA